jgi:muconate cycloisomerase
MIIERLDIWHLRLPFRFPFRHKLAAYQHSDSLVVRVTTMGGVTGFGEGIPRDFVTGDSLSASLALLEGSLGPGLVGSAWGSPSALFGGLAERLGPATATHPAAACALETALLDAGARTWGVPLARLWGPLPESTPLYYSAVLPLGPGERLTRLLELVKARRMRFLKVKVGEETDAEVLAQVRRGLGWEVDLRVDANGAWEAEEALARLQELLPFRLSAVEQPVAKHDIAGLARVQAALPIPVVADESLCTEADAARLIEARACRIFNLRLSKCGGFGPSRRLAHLARQAGIGVMLGCQVGETSILAAVGRHFAVSAGPLAYLEGSLAPYLLARDPVIPPVGFGEEGLAPPLTGHGLGIQVQDDLLQSLAIRHIALS